MVGKKRILALLPILALIVLGIVLLSIPMGKAVRARQNDQTNPGTPTPTVVAPGLAKGDLFAFAEAPVGDLDSPYIILFAYGNLPDNSPIGIQGDIDGITGFKCFNTPCKLPISTDSIIRFHAYVGGNTSPELTTQTRISSPALGKYQVKINTIPLQGIFSDSCFAIWDSPAGKIPSWAGMPNNPSHLNTDITLQYLATRLIQKGMVDVSSCTSGGMANGAPNGCGIEHAQQAMLEWQNKFDLDIWLASDAVGIPPELLKTLLLQESQFWPENAAFIVNEYGLAQINDLGADVALRWDYNLYLDLCSSVLSSCKAAFSRLPEPSRAMVRGALLKRLNAVCPTCSNGLDLDIAHASVYTIAEVVHANCWESWYIMDQNNVAPSYEDFWRFTIAAYHSGYGCLDVAVGATTKAGESIDWGNVSKHLACQGAKQYVDNFWNTLTTFNNKVVAPDIVENASVGLIPRGTPFLYPTAIATPTPAASNASVSVIVFVDKNGNNIPDPLEGVNGVTVKITFSNGSSRTATTNDQGNVVFNLTGRIVGEVENVSLVDLYRSKNVVLPQTGLVELQFKIDQPILPATHP